VRVKARGWVRLAVPLATALLAVGLSAAATPPAAAATIFTGSGFDTCGAPSASTMSAWLASPYRSLGIYIGGANRACGDGNLSASWVTTVESQGWDLAPLYVGLQAPCVDQSGLSMIDPTQPATQGAAAADDAATQARLFGLVTSTPIYFDMEAYGNDASCIATVQAFLNSWVSELHADGFLAGVYGSSDSTIANQATTPYPNKPDDIWFANWNGSTNLFGDPAFSDSLWSNDQRLHQYAADVTQTYGGVAINIDQDYDGGALAGPPQGCGGNLAPGAAAAAPPAPGGWSSWTSLGAPPPGSKSGPTVASWGPGRLDAFVTGNDGNLWHEWSGNSGASFSNWENLGQPPGGLTCAPAAVSWGTGRVDVFGRGADGALWHTYWNGSQWVAWESLGGVLQSSPAVSSWAPGRIDVMVVGTDHAVWHTWYQGGWVPWQSLGGFAVLDPAAVSWGPNRIDLFVLSYGNQLWHQWWNGHSWSGWFQEVPGHFASSPAVASWGPGRLDVFLASGGAGSPVVHLFTSSAGWQSDNALGGSLVSAPAAVGNGGQNLALVVLGTDGGLWQRTYGTP